MGRRGFQQKGLPNPLLQAKRKPPPQPTDKSIKGYLGRPRPTLDEVHQIIKDKEEKNKTMANFEEQQSKDFHKELDKYRKKMVKRAERKVRREKKKKKSKEKEIEKRKRRRESEEDSEEEEDENGKTEGGSPVQLSKFFQFVGGDDLSEGENPLSDNETDTITATTSTNNNNNNSNNNENETKEEGEKEKGEERKKKRRWDEKPAIFQHQNFPTPPFPLPTAAAMVPSIYPYHLPSLTPPAALLHPPPPILPIVAPLLPPPLFPFLPTQPLQVLQQQIQQIQQIQQMQQIQQIQQQLKVQQSPKSTSSNVQGFKPIT